jgi:type II secretory pathway component HofQ
MAAPEATLTPFTAEPERPAPRERLRESFYPNLDNDDLLKSAPDYSWSAAAESRTPTVEYDAAATKEKTSTRRTPLFAIVGTVAASAFGWTLLRNLK